MAAAKICSACKVEKALTDFSPSKLYRDGYRGQCKACRVEYQLRYSQTPAGKAAEYRYHKTAPGRRQRRKANLRYNYGISEEDFNRLLAAQNNACGICETPDQDFVVDHCHRTGIIRGLLCQKCNIQIGAMGDTYRSFYRVAEYLAGFERQPPKPCGRRIARVIASDATGLRRRAQR